MKETEQRDSWSPDDQVFIHYGKGYVVAPNLRTVCIGPVDAVGRPLEPLDKPQDSGEVVTKIVPDKTLYTETSQIQNQGIMLQRRRGRPRKQELEPVCRMTRWRRQKEKQLSLL